MAARTGKANFLFWNAALLQTVGLSEDDRDKCHSMSNLDADTLANDALKFYRNGPDHRGGWLVGFADIKKHFGFRTLRIGRWVSVTEKEASAQRFYDALQDLQLILNGTPNLISLRNTLSLHYGTGGQPGVSAHYEPATQTFALAKNAGPGSIAHEWFHAFDHYILSKAFQRAPSCTFASEAFLERQRQHPHPLNEALSDCFRVIFHSRNGGDSELWRASKLADEENGQRYYSEPYEMAARSFEAFVQDARLKNSFLVKGTKQSEEAKRGLYPTGSQRRAINMAFERYFHTLGRALQRQDSVD